MLREEGDDATNAGEEEAVADANEPVEEEPTVSTAVEAMAPPVSPVVIRRNGDAIDWEEFMEF